MKQSSKDRNRLFQKIRLKTQVVDSNNLASGDPTTPNTVPLPLSKPQSPSTDRYQLQSKLGEGGMGQVWKASDTLLRRSVALKLLHTESPGMLQRLIKEAQALARVDHAHVCRVYEVGQLAGKHCIAMEYIDGENSASASKHMTIREKAKIMLQVSEAVSAAHKMGLIHRDIKPGNILIKKTEDAGWHSYITDFGLARDLDSVDITKTGTLVGTPSYMSPEQALGRSHEVDQRTDIYGIGATLYELLSGHPPFTGANSIEVAMKVLHEDPVSLRKSHSNIPVDLNAIVLKCLEKDPAYRYQSARELAEDFKRFLNHEPIHAKHSDWRYRFIKKITSLRWRDTRNRMFKIAIPAIVAALFLAGFILFNHGRPQSLGTSKTSIAVLPFTNMGMDKEQEYFSDGLAEELTEVLSKNPKLRVISRTSAFSFKGKEVGIKTIAEKLNVTHVLEGSVRKAGNQLRITAQLIEAATDSHLWSQTYDRRLENIFAVQDDIANSVAGALKVTLEGGQTFKAKQTNPEAYIAYLQGRYFTDRRGKEDMEKAIEYYKDALQIDPNYARAWMGLSAAVGRQANWGYVARDEGFSKARRYVEKALELDPNLAEGHAQLGYIKLTHDWDWTGADAAYKRAMQLEPANAEVVRGAALLPFALGRFDEAITLSRRAIELDPLRIATYNNHGAYCEYAGRWQEAEQAHRKALELNPQCPNAHRRLGFIFLELSKPQEALAEMQKEPEPSRRAQGLAIAYHALGNKKEADAGLAEYIEKYHKQGAFYIAEIYAYRGETDKALEWLERAYKQRDSGLAQMKGDPLLRSLERDPRYRDFLQKMKLPLD